MSHVQFGYMFEDDFYSEGDFEIFKSPQDLKAMYYSDSEIIKVRIERLEEVCED